MPDSWNNRTSSLKVFHTDGGYFAQGRWIRIASYNESFDFEFSVGFDSSYSIEYQETQEYTLSYQMKTGFEFESETVSETYTSSMMYDA